VDKADLVGVHEAGIAHHVAAVRQIDGQNRPAAVRHRRSSVVVQLFVVVSADVASGENFLKVTEELRVDRHHVFEMAVSGAVLDHQDLAVALDDLRLNLANLLIQKDFVRQLAVDNLLANLRNALRAQRIGGAGPAKRRLLFLIRLEQRLIGPLRRKGRIWADTVELLENGPGSLGRDGDRSFCVLDGFRHVSNLLVPVPPIRKCPGGGRLSFSLLWS